MDQFLLQHSAHTLKCMRKHRLAKLPTRGTSDSVGYDLYSIVETTIHPNEQQEIDTGISITPPLGTYAQIMDRSSLASKRIVVNGKVIDPDYTGNIRVLLENNGNDKFKINVHDRIAQLIIHYVDTPTIVEVNHLPETTRNTNGFGSTGK